MSRSPYLTKSRFKLALECPTKLYYVGKKDIYADNGLDDSFLRALAEGGLQVGELAKLYHPDGIEIEERDHDQALRSTSELLQMENVTLFEAAFAYENLFIRVDILEKRGSTVKLIEVKSKSFYDDEKFQNRDRTISSEWKPYIYDVAFQKYVLSKALPGYQVLSYLMLVSKDAIATVEGLYQRFFISREGGRAKIIVADSENLGEPILKRVNIDGLVETIFTGIETINGEQLSFNDYVQRLSDAYTNDRRLLNGVKKECRDCQFKLDSHEVEGLKSGFHQCWIQHTQLTAEQLKEPLVLDIWNCREKDSFLSAGIYLQKYVDTVPYQTKAEMNPLNIAGRQLLQINKSTSNDDSLYLDKYGLLAEMEDVSYPLHFIDFETTRVPIPFHKERRPNEQIAFQFSHHIVDQDGTVAHASQWLNTEGGAFPNFTFVRKLRDALSGDKGSIFKYSHHENTVLCEVREQLLNSNEPDKVELVAWIETITRKTEGKGKKEKVLWHGTRNMIDMLAWIKSYYFDPRTKGSNSLKVILPSIISRSAYLQTKYSAPVYGDTIFSHNFPPTIWVQPSEGGWVDPYSLLPTIFNGYRRNELDLFVISEDEVNDGGAAMMAYNYMQFPQMNDVEHKATIAALLRYCELDTFAMVMLWEGLNDLVRL